MPFAATKNVPPLRSTGDGPPAGVAGDVNALSASVAELQAGGLVRTADSGTVFEPAGLSDATKAALNAPRAYPDLPSAQSDGAAGKIPVGSLVVIAS